jgi:hypothetical protein
MMMHHVGTKAFCEALQRAADKILGYPRPGRRIGGGRHAEGGTTATAADVRRHPTREQWAYQVTGELIAALALPGVSDALRAHPLRRLRAEVLPDDWEAAAQ